MVRTIDCRSPADFLAHASGVASDSTVAEEQSQQSRPSSFVRSITPTHSEQGAQRRLGDACEQAAQSEFEQFVRQEAHDIADAPAEQELVAGTIELRDLLQDITPHALQEAIEVASQAAAGEIEQIMRTPTLRQDPERAAGNVMADSLLARHGAGLALDAEAPADLQRAFEKAADGLMQAGDTVFSKADQTVRDMLCFNSRVSIGVGGAAAVGTGYSIGMWVMMRAVLPRLQHLPPALQGFIGGWIVSSIDKVMSSGFAAVAAANQYGKGSLEQVPTLASTRPSLRRVATTAALIAGLGTFIKNLSGRGLSVQVAVPDRYVTALTDLTADTALSFVSAAFGKYATMKRLGREQEALVLLARDDFADEVRRFKQPISAARAAQDAVANAAIFARAAGRSATLPSSWIAGLYCASLMAALMQSHDHINRKYGATGNVESRMEAFEHTLASSGLMALLVTGAVGIGILGVCDGHRQRLLQRIAASFSTPPAVPTPSTDA